MENEKVILNEEIQTKQVDSKETKGSCWCACFSCGSMKHCGGFMCDV